MSEKRNSPISVETVDSDHSMWQGKQTGFDTINIEVLKMVSHDDDTPWDDRIALSSERTGFNDYVDLAKASPTKHKTKAWSGEMPLLDFLLELQCQADTLIHGWASFVNVDMSVSTALITVFYEDTFRGLTKRPPPYIVYPGGVAATSLYEYLGGFSWLQSGLDIVKDHVTWFRRWIYAFAYHYSKYLPNFWDRFESMTNDQITRTVYVFLCAIIQNMVDFFYYAALQSERAMFALGFLDKRLLSKKIPQDFASSVDNIWIDIIQQVKHAEVMTGFDEAQYTSNYLDVSLLNGTTLEDSIREWNTNYIGTNDTLQLARQMFGIGKAEYDGTEHFAILLDLWNYMGELHTQEPLTAGHGQTSWVLGNNTLLALEYFEDVSRYRSREWDLAFSRRKHWTYVDISAFSKTLYTEFSFTRSFHGVAENTAYRGYRATVNFIPDDFDFPQTSSYFADPDWALKAAAPDNVYVNGLVQSTNEMPASFWIYPFLGQQAGWRPNNDVVFYANWSDQERQNFLRWGMLLGRRIDSALDVPYYGELDQCRICATSIRMVEFLDISTKARIGFMYDATNEQVRWKNLSTVLNADYISVSVMYMCTAMRYQHVLGQWNQSPRPGPGIKDNHPIRIHNIIDDNCQLLLSSSLVQGGDAPKSDSKQELPPKSDSKKQSPSMPATPSVLPDPVTASAITEEEGE